MQQNIPPMVVTPLTGSVVQTQRRYVKDEELSTPENKRYRMEEFDEKMPAGYLVTFPAKGHSIRVDEAELKRLESRLVDPSAMVMAEKYDGDSTQILRAAGGNALVNVIMEAPTKGGTK